MMPEQSGEGAKKQNYAILIAGIVGIILLWRGIWEVSAKFISAEASLILGALVIVAILLVAKKRALKILAG